MKTLSPWLIRYNGDENSDVRLFCFHYAGGSAMAFRSWAQHFPASVELIAIQLPVRDGRYAEPPMTDASIIVENLLPEISGYLEKPYIVFGHSLGALVSFELLRALKASRLPLPKLFVPSAHRAPHLPARAAPIYRLSDKEFLVRLERFEGTSKDILENEELMSAFLPRIRADFLILETYSRKRPEPLGVPVYAIMGREDVHVCETDLRSWSEYSSDFRHRLFEGGHFFIETAKREVLDMIRQECEKLTNPACGQRDETLAYLFPGQGSQHKGMGGGLFREFPEITRKADEILGYSIESLCLEDRDGRLNKTQYTQPALYTVNALSYLASIRDTGQYPAYCAGHSLGEYSALYAAGALSFEDGLKLVQKRGELMSRADPGAMAAVLNLEESALRRCLADHRLEGIDIANYNSAAQLVISGLKDDIARARAPLEALGARFVTLNAGGAFHSRYMAAAKDEFYRYIRAFRFARPQCEVIANVTAKPYENSGFEEILAQQITGSVRWKETVEYLLALGVTRFEEVGPGTVLAKLAKQIEKDFVRPVRPPESTPVDIRQRIDEWNRKYPVGTRVAAKGYDQPLVTASEAILLFGHRAAIYMTHYNGYFDLDDIAPLNAA